MFIEIKDKHLSTDLYITKYIVDNTVGKLCEEKKTAFAIIDADFTPNRQVATKKKLLANLESYRAWLLQITICDPACGSGAFLNQALDFLIKEHTYIDELQTKLLGGGFIFPNIENTVLENNIFGVDLNEESVEIAKLSLWLRTAQPRRKLNDLNSNIKCGNSLIDSKAVAGDKAFHWETEFPQVFNQSLRGTKQSADNKNGFDVIIGNPPYGADLSKETTLLKKIYNTFSLSGESYILFVEKSIYLLKNEGKLGFIIPDTYLNLAFSENVRNFILKNSLVENIVMLPANTFEAATVDTTNLIITKKEKKETPYITDVKINLVNKKSKTIEFDSVNKEFYVSTDVWVENNSFLIYSDKKEISLLKKIDDLKLRVSELADIYSGIKAYEVGKGTPKQTKEIRETKPFTSINKIDNNWLPFYEGKHISSYSLEWENNGYIKYGEWLAAPREPKQFLDEKILIRKIIGSRLIATYVSETSYCNTLLFILKLKDSSVISYQSLLGFLNSKLIAWFFRHKFQISDDDTFPQIMIRDILKFPIIISDSNKKIEYFVNSLLKFNSEISSVNHKFQTYLISQFQLEKLSKKLQNWYTLDFADFIKELNKAIKSNKLPPLTKLQEMDWMEVFEVKKAEAQTLKTQIDQTDKEIDAMVYELYGLTEDEIKIVENS